MASYIPPRRTNRLAYLQSVSTLITANPTDYGLDAGQATDLATRVGTLTTEIANQETARSAAKAQSATTQTADSDAESYFRNLAAIAVADPLVDDAMLATIGLARRDPNPSPRPAPATAPEFTLLKLEPNLAYFSFRDAGSAGPRGRATNAIGVQVSLVNASAPPLPDEANLGVISLMTRTYRSVPTIPGIVPHRAYARWVTQRGLLGPWSTGISFNAQMA